MTVEYASSRRRSAASKMLRKLMVKFTRRSESIVYEAAFNGTNTEPLTLVESNKREQIRKGSMLSATAERVMQEVDANLPWRQRLELIEALAAVARLYPSEMDRKVPGPNRTVREMLFSACSPQRLGWFFNNVKALAALPSHYMELLPSGTTSNAALHAELKAWFRQTQEMHKSTLHASVQAVATQSGSATTDAATLLCRASALSPWKRAEWISFAASTEKACLPLAGKRKAEVATVREFVRLTTFCIQSIMAFKPRFVFSKKAGTEPVKAETLRTKAQVVLKETWPCLGLGFYGSGAVKVHPLDTGALRERAGPLPS